MTDPIDTALLPCPFCGGAAQRITIGDDEPANAGGDVICCTICQASSHVEFGRKENLVALWNTRAASQADTARAEGLALGLAMAKAAPRYDCYFDPDPNGDWVDLRSIPAPPIPPHVAAARVLLDDLNAGKTNASWDDAWQAMARNFEDHDWNNWPNHFRAALEQIAKEGE